MPNAERSWLLIAGCMTRSFFINNTHPTPVPQIWWFSSDIARSINLLTYLLTYFLDHEQIFTPAVLENTCDHTLDASRCEWHSQSPFGHRKRITELCSLRDAFNGNLMRNYNWCYSEVILYFKQILNVYHRQWSHSACCCSCLEQFAQFVTSAHSMLVFQSHLKTRLYIISYPNTWLCIMSTWWHCVVFGHFNRSCLYSKYTHVQDMYSMKEGFTWTLFFSQDILWCHTNSPKLSNFTDAPNDVTTKPNRHCTA